jgi:archaeal flagellar protein FlaJ
MRIPFCPLSVKKAQSMLGSKLYGLTEPILKISPNFDLDLRQAGFDINARDYISIAIFSALFMAFISFFMFLFVVMLALAVEQAMSLSFLIGMVLGVVTFFYIKIYPKLIVKRRMMDVERNLIFGLRHMYVQITSGVPIFEAIISVSKGNYGAISEEFSKVVKNVNTGMSLDNALDELTKMNPSQYFRRAMWQISNSVKTGSDLGHVIRSIMDYLSAEQRIMIKRYGSQLNPLTLAYMMVAVIMPSLGVTFLIVLSSFSKIPITESIFWMILAALVIFQFMFLGIIKSKRPNLV